jgi:hypothetical protein
VSRCPSARPVTGTCAPLTNTCSAKLPVPRGGQFSLAVDTMGPALHRSPRVLARVTTASSAATAAPLSVAKAGVINTTPTVQQRFRATPGHGPVKDQSPSCRRRPNPHSCMPFRSRARGRSHGAFGRGSRPSLDACLWIVCHLLVACPISQPPELPLKSLAQVDCTG